MSSEDTKRHNTPEILKEGILKNRIFSSYLFVGPDGSGKLEAAATLAKAVNCLDGKKKPCQICLACKKINSRAHPDVFFVEPTGSSSSVGIDQIRELIRCANLKPYEARTKVFVINNAHSMNAASSNAFLKTLEEPPENTIFILISLSRDLLLPTIVSRCCIIRFFAGERSKPAYLPEYPCDKEGLKKNLEFLISFFRDVFLYKTVNNEKMLFHAERRDEIKKEADRLTSDRLDYIIKRLITLRSYIDYNVNPKIIRDVLANEIKQKIESSK